MNKMSHLRLWAIFTLAALTAVLPATAQKSSAIPEVSTTITISQVYSGGGGSSGTYLNDYVELKNVSATSQSLSGLSLMYGSSTGNFGSSSTSIYALPSVTLLPGQYFLVQTSTAGSGGTALPVTPDATTTNLSMAAGSGKVLLANSTFASNTCGATATPCTLPNAGIIDLVSWGATNNAEGGVTVNNGVALTSTQGSVRKLSGCQDTDNNNADFDVVTAPVPRNTATAPSACGTGIVNTQHVIDFNGDGRTDWAVVRNTGGGASGQVTWFVANNGAAGGNTVPWGIATDFFVPGDYDGDLKTDYSVWRPGLPGVAAWYTLQSSTNTLRGEAFGQTGDDPTVLGDYNNDGKDDVAVYRPGAATGLPSYWFYRTVAQGGVFTVQWGQNGDFPAPGDYDGDGNNDFVVQRNGGGGQAVFFRRYATGSSDTVVFGIPTDVIVPGDYDGDGKTDIAVVRGIGGQIYWFHIPSSAPSGYVQTAWGLSATDFPTQGDYDGDGKTDQAVWRPNADATQNFFFVNNSTAGFQSFEWGQNGDYPVANYNTH